MKVGIIGYGFVGQSIDFLLKDDVEVQRYDVKEPYNGNKQDLLENDINFICVPTPAAAGGAQDASIVTNWLEFFETLRYKGLVVIKSTVLYRHIKDYESKINLVFNPEFLNQNTFIEDAANQKCIMIGGEVRNQKILMDFYSYNCDFGSEVEDFKFVTLKEACDFKYTRNMYNAYKLLFWEFIQDTTGNARLMSELLKSFPQKSEMSQVGMDGFRGFGGACLPKDVLAWDKEHKHELTRFMLEFNEKLNSSKI